MLNVLLILMLMGGTNDFKHLILIFEFESCKARMANAVFCLDLSLLFCGFRDWLGFWIYLDLLGLPTLDWIGIGTGVSFFSICVSFCVV